jgi:Arc/MetJ-type ribon-helix-helix transcriptional regulator
MLAICYHEAMMVKPKPHKKPVPVRIPPEMVDRLDALRGAYVSREAYVRMLLDRAMRVEERKAAKREEA